MAMPARRLRELLVVICVAACVARAQAAARFASAQERIELAGPGEDARLAPARTLDSEHLFHPPPSPRDWSERREELRTRVLVAAGLWPMPHRRPLAARIEGSIEREGYVVQHVAIESFPGFYVTGNLYRPEPAPSGNLPGVLCPHGHWNQGRFCTRTEDEGRHEIEIGAEKHLANARFHLQARCATLARMGSVVFHYDMVGFADAVQLEHGRGFEDAEALLEMQSAFGLQTWNSIRALDFLLSLPDVDPQRIGVTGASGGGTQTFILCAVDDRPRVALPAVMVSSAMQGGCICENAPYLRIGTDNVELAALMAPRPLCLTGANDWTIAIEKKGLPELRAIYGLFGAADAVFAECHPEFDHNYNQVSRELCYRWFAKWLALEAPESEPEIVPASAEELSVWSSFAAPACGPEVLASVRATWRADTHEMLEGSRETVLPALEILLGTSLPPAGSVEAREVATKPVASGAWRELLLSRAGSREVVPATLLAPASWNGRTVIAVSGAGRATFFETGARLSAQRVFANGARFLAIEPFQSGAWLEPGGTPRARIDTERHADYAGYSLAYNRPLVAERVHDVLTAIAWARAQDGAREIVLVGLGDAASWVWLARTQAGESIARTILERAGDPWSVTSAADPELLPGIGRYRGEHDLAPLVFPGEVVLFGSGNFLRRAGAYYAARGRPDAALELKAEQALDLASWIDAPLGGSRPH